MTTNEPKVCPNDCIKCSFQQQVYCAAFMSRTMIDKVKNLEEKVDNLTNSITGNPTTLVNPMQPTDVPQQV
jgi:hypothetical protein